MTSHLRTWLAASVLFLAPTLAIAQSAAVKPQYADDDALRARYTLPSSHFVQLDGETIHYSDEGKGPAILLLHGSYASLRQWDPWAERLRNNYRIIRFDKSPAGLSGPSPRGDYSTVHQIRQIDELMSKLDIADFVIVGTSSAGVLAAAYAATRPERIKGMILTDIADGPVRIDIDSLSPRFQAVLKQERTHPGWHSRQYWRQILRANVVDTVKVTPELIERWTQLNHRMMRDPAVAQAVRVASDLERTPADLGHIMAPTLLLWGEQDHETPVPQHALAAMNDLATKDKTLVVLPRCGHMLVLDCPIRSLERALPFLARTTSAE